MKLKKRLVIVGGLVVAVVVAAVVQKLVQHRGHGTLVVFAPADRAVDVEVDGKPHALAAGGFVRVSAAPGKHRVAVVGGPTRDVTLESGLHILAVPTLATQCFVELDVTVSHYGQGGVAPTVTGRFRRDQPFILPDYPLSNAELPKERVDKVRRGKVVGVQLVHLFRTETCDPTAAYNTRIL
jgi:hypothetical protein